MLMRRTSWRGMGSTVAAGPLDPLELISGGDCSQYLTWLVNPNCWGQSITEWTTQKAYGNVLPVNAKGANTTGVIDYSNPVSTLATGVQEDPQSAISAAIVDQTLANQAANLLAVQTQGPGPNAVAGCSQSLIQGVCDWIVYAAAAAALVGMALMVGRGR